MFDFVHHKRTIPLKRRQRRRIGKKHLLSSFAIVSLLAVLIIFIGSIAVFGWYARGLPDPNKVARKSGFSTIIYDRNGQVLYDIFEDKNRIPVTIDKIPKYLQQATIAVEDKTFYQHEGYSTKGLLRAIYSIIFKGSLQGGSTLTQQLVKNTLLTTERTLPRKIKEFMLAVQIERKYSKDEILQMYLNEAPYGGTAWGVESGAKQYFGKSVSELNLVESVILAGLPQLPSVYSPFNTKDPKAYAGRAETVLRRMREDGYISKEEEKQAKEALPYITFSNSGVQFEAPHFVMYVKKALIEQFGEDVVENGGLRVTTTLDLDLQKKAEGIIKEELEKIKSLNAGNSAAVVLDPNTGEILAHVGSKSFKSDENDYGGEFDVATQGLRQPGSALKPFVYATAFQNGYTPSSILMDVQSEFTPDGTNPYKPQNYDGQYRGAMQMRFALANSINTIAVKTLALAGVRDFLTQAYKMGLTTLEPTNENLRRFGLAISLGGGEVHLMDLTSAFGVFATGGEKHEPVSIVKIEDKNGKKIYEFKPRNGEKVLSSEISFLISHILSDNTARSLVFGTNSWLNIPGKTVAVKTGTTDDKRDNWTVGYSKDAVVGVWVGNNDNTPMNPKLASGVTGAAPIWNRIIRAVFESGKKDGIIDKPDTVEALTIDAFGGGLPVDGQPTRSEYFIKGTQPTSPASIYQKLKLSRRQSDRLASSDEIRAGDYDEKDYIVIYEDDPLSSDGVNRWQQAIESYLASNSDSKLRPPRQTSDVSIPTSVPTSPITPTPTLESTPTPSLTPTAE